MKYFTVTPSHRYLAFFKPFEVLSQFTTESEKATLARFGFPPNVYPVGRLDYDSEGLLLLSDDPRLNATLLPPEREHQRTYYAQVEGIPSEQALEQLRHGVPIQGRPTRPALCRLIEPPAVPERSRPIRYRKNVPDHWIALSLTEGRNRQVRRMTAAVGHPTLRLIRTAIGSLNLFELGLQPGEWRDLTPDEVAKALQLQPGAQPPVGEQATERNNRSTKRKARMRRKRGGPQ